MADSSGPGSDLSTSEFRIGRVFNRSSAILSRNLVTYLAISGLAALPYELLSTAMDDHQDLDPVRPGVVVIVAMVFGTLSQAAIVFGAFQDMRGRQAGVGDCLRVGLERAVPVVGLAILASLGIGVGLLTLIIPGLILAVMWIVTAPACVVERLGPIQSIGRSTELTRGHRWKIAGAWLLIYLVAFSVETIMSSISSEIGGPITAFMGSLLWSAIWGAFYAIFVAVMYNDLRVAREGVDIDQIASVFD
jgi:hypothetical protein